MRFIIESILIIFIWTSIPNVNSAPSIRSAKEYVRGCYYTNWAQYRPEPWKFLPENYEPGLCTHLFYAFVIMNNDFTLKAFEWNDEDNNGSPGMYNRVNALKQKQPDLKILLSFGGWTFSQGNAALMRQMVTNTENRRKFIHSAISFVRRIGLDGFDLDWEYPDWGTKAAYTSLVKEFRESFENESTTSGKPRLLLTAGVAAGIDRISAGYNGKALASALDFINVMTYDLHGAWEQKTGLNTPLYDLNGDRLSVNSSMTYWNANLGVPKEKLVIGFATYGRGWTIQQASSSQIGSPANGPSQAQQYTRENGMAAYYEICNLIETEKLRSQWDPVQRTPYAVGDNIWLGYDDVKSFNEKLDWLIQNGYAGAFVWALDMDDFLGRCTSSGGVKYPLISAIKSKLGDVDSDQAVPPSNSPLSNTTSITLKTTSSPSSAPTAPSPAALNESSNIVASTPAGPFKCPGPGLYPDPTSCTSFYQCDDIGNPYKLPCPAGLHFNKESTICDWPHAAGCDQSATTPV